MWFIGVEVVEQETSAPPPKKNPGSAPVVLFYYLVMSEKTLLIEKISFLSPRYSTQRGSTDALAFKIRTN